MEVIRLAETKPLSIAKKMLEVLEYGISFQDFEAQLKKELDQLGVDLLKVVLESLDQQLRVVQLKGAWHSKYFQPRSLFDSAGQPQYVCGSLHGFLPASGPRPGRHKAYSKYVPARFCREYIDRQYHFCLLDRQIHRLQGQEHQLQREFCLNCTPFVLI